MDAVTPLGVRNQDEGARERIRCREDDGERRAALDGELDPGANNRAALFHNQ